MRQDHLGRAALRLIRATGGAIRFDGEDVTALKGERLRPFIAARR